MVKNKILSLLAQFGQGQLNAGLNTLSLQQQEAFLSQLNKYDASILKKQRDSLFHKRKPSPDLEPLKRFERAGSATDIGEGERLIEEGKVACLILAGGQSSRLESAGPKGIFPISPVKGKTLFQLFFEKTLAASRKANRSLPLAIMTSPLNGSETRSYLESNGWFGLDAAQVDLFSQEMLPFMDDRGNWLLEAPGKNRGGARWEWRRAQRPCRERHLGKMESCRRRVRKYYFDRQSSGRPLRRRAVRFSLSAERGDDLKVRP